MKVPRLYNGKRTTLVLQILRAADCAEGYIPTVYGPVPFKASREPRLLSWLQEVGWLEKRVAAARNGKLPLKRLPNKVYAELQRVERRYHLTEKGRIVLDVATKSPETLKATIALLTE
jgi:hypothetical protein